MRRSIFLRRSLLGNAKSTKGSTSSSALVEAYDVDGKRIAKDGLEHVPVRKTPEDHVPFFELAVEGDGIAYIEISGSQPGGFVAVDEIRWSK